MHLQAEIVTGKSCLEIGGDRTAPLAAFIVKDRMAEDLALIVWKSVEVGLSIVCAFYDPFPCCIKSGLEIVSAILRGNADAVLPCIQPPDRLL